MQAPLPFESPEMLRMARERLARDNEILYRPHACGMTLLDYFAGQVAPEVHLAAALVAEKRKREAV